MAEGDPALLWHDPLRLSGTPEVRGAHQSSDCSAAARPLVGRSINSALQQARLGGLLDAQGQAFLAEQFEFHTEYGPGVMAELGGIAQGFGLSVEDVFAFHHLGALDVRKTGRTVVTDGCSAWGVASGRDGPLLVKNRDSAAQPDRPQSVMMHHGADISGGAMICVGTLGSPGAYSSGMNASGLAVGDTHVTAQGVGVGWLRLFLATHLMTQFDSVDAALDYIGRVPHAGGGTLVLADAGGSVAGVDFDLSGPTIRRGGPVWRTNHFTTPAPHRGSQKVVGDAIDANSLSRFTHIGAALADGDWDVGRAKQLMATHDGAPICQHRNTDDADTISTAIFACKTRVLTYSRAHPCAGDWQRFTPDTWLAPLGATAPSST